MGTLKNILNNMAQGWKSLSTARKTGIIVLAAGTITALILFVAFFGKPRYEPLFLNMSSEDMAKVVDMLKQEKTPYKLSGDKILVPENQVEELRLSIAASGTLPSNGKGFELFDQSRFGATDTETKILYQRALETELQRTIKAFDAVEYVRVHLVLPEPSVFIRSDEEARASITIKIKNSKKLEAEQVKAIVALVSGSVKNLPKENVEVVDTNFNLLSQDNGSNDFTSPESITDRYGIEKQFEGKIEDDLKKMLEAVFGVSKVKVAVNADLDFDSKQVSSIKYDAEGIVKNQHKITETNTNGGSVVSGSPIDNNSSNNTQVKGNGSGSSREEENTEYNIGQVEEKTIKAPGEVKRLSTSVVIDGTLSEANKNAVTNIVMSATGFDENRGDLINIEGMAFDDTLEKQMEADLKELETAEAQQERAKRLFTYIGLPLLGLLAFIMTAVAVSRHRNRRLAIEGGVDMVINEPITVNEVIKKQSELKDSSSQTDISSEILKRQAILNQEVPPDLSDEIKKYASRKPDQVVEIIKSWLAEDER